MISIISLPNLPQYVGEYTKIGVDKSGEPARPTKLFIILGFLDEHSCSLTLPLDQIAAPPSHNSISLATCCSKCLYNTNVDVSLPQREGCVCAYVRACVRARARARACVCVCVCVCVWGVHTPVVLLHPSGYISKNV